MNPERHAGATPRGDDHRERPATTPSGPEPTPGIDLSDAERSVTRELAAALRRPGRGTGPLRNGMPRSPLDPQSDESGPASRRDVGPHPTAAVEPVVGAPLFGEAGPVPDPASTAVDRPPSLQAGGPRVVAAAFARETGSAGQADLIIADAERRAATILGDARAQAERELAAARAEASRLIESVAAQLTNATRWDQARPTLQAAQQTGPAPVAPTSMGADGGASDRAGHAWSPLGADHSSAGSTAAAPIDSGPVPSADRGSAALTVESAAVGQEAATPAAPTAAVTWTPPRAVTRATPADAAEAGPPGGRAATPAPPASGPRPRPDVPAAPRQASAARPDSAATVRTAPGSGRRARSARPARSAATPGGPGAGGPPRRPWRRPPGGDGSRGAWGLLVHRLRWLVLALGTAVLLVGALWGPGVIERLSAGGFDVPGSESDRADTRIAATVGAHGADVVALYRSDTLTVDDPRFQAAVADVLARIPEDPEVRGAASFWTTGATDFVSADRHATYVAVQLAGTSDEKEAYLRGGLPEALAIDAEIAGTQIGGPTALGVELGDRVASDLAAAELLSAPLLAALLVLIFGGLVAAGLPLLVGGLAVVTAFVVLRLLLHVTDISLFAINLITLLGLGLAIDYALLIVSRFREELHAGHATEVALSRTMTTAGRSVVVSAGIVAVSLSGLLFFPQVFLRSMAYGGVAAVVVAAISALTVLPAVLAVLGSRVDALRIPWPRRIPREPDTLGRHAARRLGGWERLARAVMARPAQVAAAVTAVLLLLTLPALGARFGGVDERQLAAGSEGRQVAEALADDFDVQNQPITVLLEDAAPGQVDAFRMQLEDVPGVRQVRLASAEDEVALFAVDYPGEARDELAMAVVERLRDLTAPDGVTVLVGGPSAVQVDMQESLVSGLWRMAVLVGAVTFLVLFWAFGSVLLPIKAMLMTLLTVGASFGLVVLIFQYGWGAGLLGVESTGYIEATQPILVLAILFGLTTDYEVFLLSRVRERWDAGDDNATAVAIGLQRTGPVITAAASLMLVVTVVFATSSIGFVKLVGIGMAVSIVLDATVVRGLLVPATMHLLGTWNWWAPAPLAAWWQRHRPAAEELAELVPGRDDRVGQAVS